MTSFVDTSRNNVYIQVKCRCRIRSLFTYAGDMVGRLAILAATTVLAHQIPHFRSTIPKVLLLLKKLVDDFRLEILANDVMELVWLQIYLKNCRTMLISAYL